MAQSTLDLSNEDCFSLPVASDRDRVGTIVAS